AEEILQHADRRDRHADDDQALRRDHRAADQEVAGPPRRRKTLRLGGVELLHDFFQEQREAEGRDDQRQHAVAQDRVDHQALEDQAQHQQRGGEDDQQRERERQPAELHRRQHEERRQHDELALREVDGLRGLPQQHETDRDERVDAARRDARDCQLQKVGQDYSSRLATCPPSLLAELRQDLDYLLLAVHHLDQEADAVDVAVRVPGGLDQD